MKLAFPKKDYNVCIYTDSSEESQVAFISQKTEDQLKKTVGTQQHEPVAFLGGRFSGTQKKWTTYRKEAHAVVQTVDKIDYLFWRAALLNAFQDHKNLLYAFASYPSGETLQDMFCLTYIYMQYTYQDSSSSLIT